MKNRLLKNSFTYFFLVLFISLKLTGLHVFSHSDDKEHAEHCIICDHAITHNLTPAITPESEYSPIEKVEFVVAKGEITSYSFLGEAILTKSELFSRPPPTLM